MLDRMMIDISRWIIMIVIFFIAFSCSLYLLFSYFAVALQQQNTLTQSSSIINSSISIIDQNSTIINYATCPDYFYKVLNQSTPFIIYYQETDNTDKNGNIFCQQSPDYNTYKEIGPYPAIYYFGQSFQTTLLTTFFTLFNVIGEIGMPVSM